LTAQDLKGLAVRLAEGHEDAARELYATYGQRLYRFVLARLRRPDAAEDVVQETLTAAWRNAGTYRGDGFSAWLFGICRNKVADRLRREGPGWEPLDLSMVGGSGLVGEAAEFWESFGRLSAEQQELVLLVFYYGFSQREAAGILGIPVGTAKSRTYYARRRLQELLQGGGGDG